MESTGRQFVFLHSLLLGPASWEPVAVRLGGVVPSLRGVADGEPPFWPGVVERVLAAAPRGEVTVVAHSNAGLLVPAVVGALGDRVAGCVLVDASLPPLSGPARPATPERLAVLRAMAVGGMLPPWTEWWAPDQVARLLPDPRVRADIVDTQPRLPLRWYEHALPVPPDWDDRPCSYVWFSAAYGDAAREARDRGWRVTHIPGEHLHQVVDPEAVAAGISGR